MSKTKPFNSIGVDFDGVLCDWHLSAAGFWFAYSAQHESVTELAQALDKCWATGGDFAEIVGIPERDCWDILNNPDWWAGIPMMTTRFTHHLHPVLLMEYLRRYSDDVYISTAAPSFAWPDHSLKSNCFAGKTEWLYRVFGSNPPPFVYHSSTGVKRTRRYGVYDLLIDDSLSNCKAAVEYDGTAFHFDAYKLNKPLPKGASPSWMEEIVLGKVN